MMKRQNLAEPSESIGDKQLSFGTNVLSTFLDESTINEFKILFNKFNEKFTLWKRNDLFKVIENYAKMFWSLEMTKRIEGTTLSLIGPEIKTEIKTGVLNIQNVHQSWRQAF